MSEQFEALAARADYSIVQIVTRGYAPASESGPPMLQAQRGSGSGVIVDPSGYIVTNAHVVGSMRRVQVLLPQAADPRVSSSIVKPSAKVLKGIVVGSDRETDIAIIKVDPPTDRCPISLSGTPKNSVKVNSSLPSAVPSASRIRSPWASSVPSPAKCGRTIP